MLLLLRQHPEIHHRLLFGTDYPLHVFHFPAWGRVELTRLKKLMKTTNRFDRQFLICRMLGLKFGSLQDVVPTPPQRSES